MLHEQSQLKLLLSKLYDGNPFVNLLDMKIVELEEGRAKISMPVIPNKHTNLYNAAHGGALASLADTVMGVACATTGKKVVTLDMNLNYLRSAKCEDTVIGVGSIIHNGTNTIVAEAELLDSSNELLVKARATFFVIGTFF